MSRDDSTKELLGEVVSYLEANRSDDEVDIAEKGILKPHDRLVVLPVSSGYPYGSGISLITVLISIVASIDASIITLSVANNRLSPITIIIAAISITMVLGLITWLWIMRRTEAKGTKRISDLYESSIGRQNDRS